MEIALIGLLGAALFSTIGLLGAAVLGIRRDLSGLREDFVEFRAVVEGRFDGLEARLGALEEHV